MKKKFVIGILFSFLGASSAWAGYKCIDKDKSLELNIIHEPYFTNLTSQLQKAVAVVHDGGGFTTALGDLYVKSTRAGSINHYSFELESGEELNFKLKPKEIIYIGKELNDCTRAGCDTFDKFPKKCIEAECSAIDKFPSKKHLLIPASIRSFNFKGTEYALTCN